jgi:hypothetical protein
MISMPGDLRSQPSWSISPGVAGFPESHKLRNGMIGNLELTVGLDIISRQRANHYAPGHRRGAMALRVP